MDKDFPMGTNRHSSIYRLLLPLLLALMLAPLAQAQEETQPILSCQLQPDTVAVGGTSQFTLYLSNLPPGLDLAQLAVTVDYTNPTLIVTPEQTALQAGDLLALEFTQSSVTSGQMQIRATRVGSNPIAATEGTLARIDLQTAQESGLVAFTLSAGSLRRSDNSEIPFLAEPTCYLAIGDAELPTPTVTPTATSTGDFPTATTTPTVTETAPPSILETPSVTPTWTPSLTPTPTTTDVQTPTTTLTPTATFTPTATQTPTVPVVVATPTPRLDELQSPLATPTPITVTPATPGQTPNIALTLTAEAQAILLDEANVDIVDVTPFPTQPGSLPPAPTATPPPMEILSPPRLEDDPTSPAATAISVAAAVADEMVQPASADILPAEAASALAVETLQQPAAGIIAERNPLLLRLGWTTFMAAVVLTFTSWWLRRQR